MMKSVISLFTALTILAGIPAASLAPAVREGDVNTPTQAGAGVPIIAPESYGSPLVLYDEEGSDPELDPDEPDVPEEPEERENLAESGKTSSQASAQAATVTAFDIQDYRTGGRQEQVYTNGAWQYYYYDTTTGAQVLGWARLPAEENLPERVVYFDPTNNGYMAKGYRTIGTATYYFNSLTGNLQTGEVSMVSNGVTVWRYLDPVTFFYRENAWVVLRDPQYGGNKLVYYDQFGNMVRGVQNIGGQLYRFRLDSGGLMYGEVYINESWYYLGLGRDPAAYAHGQNYDGTLAYARGLFELPDQRTVYYNEVGQMQYQEVYFDDGSFLFFHPVTGAKINGEVKVGNDWRYYTEVNGVYTQIKGSFFTLDDGRRVYYGSDGAMLKGGPYQIEGQSMYFNPTTGNAMDNGGEIYVNGQWMYVDPSTKMIVRDTWIPLGERWVYYDANGHMAKGEVYVHGTPYMFSTVTGTLRYGELKFTDGWRYLDRDSRQYASGWTVLPGANANDPDRIVYYDPNGGNVMVKGTVAIGNNMYIFANYDGALQTGEVNFGPNAWYYLDPRTIDLSNGSSPHYTTNEMVDLGSKIVYYGPDGRMCYGLQNIGNATYYFHPTLGSLMTGLQLVNNNYYYFGNDGRLETGLKPWNGSTYYFSPQTGAMVTGLQSIGGSEYYFSPQTGAMVTGYVYLDQKSYFFNPDGTKRSGALLGMDISSNQGHINWAAVKNSGVEFVIIRVLAWSSAANNYKIDDRFLEYYAGAKAAGLLVGAYLYSYTTDNARAAREVAFIYNSPQWAQAMAIGQLDLPLFVDYEDSYQITATPHATAEQRSDWIQYEMDLLYQEGLKRGWSVTPGFYTYLLYGGFNKLLLQTRGYPFWLAHFDVAQHGWTGPAPYMWQFTSSAPGRDYGVSSTRLDLNYLYLS